MEVLATKRELRTAVAAARMAGERIALVPTMGALHEGHLSLVRSASAAAGTVVVSIFVNPTQFDAAEDLAAYPRDLTADLELLKSAGVSAVFAPTPDEVYDGTPTVTVHPGRIGEVLEGASRPGHFEGVCTVVSKLLNLVAPDVAFFGEKDFQQLQVVRAMVHDLDIPVAVTGVATVREPDGLALSSRNVRLSPEDRTHALALARALLIAQDAAAAGETDARWIAAAMDAALAGEERVEPDYAEVVDPETLAPLHVLDRPARAVVAATVGGVRLIDNGPLVPREVSR